MSQVIRFGMVGGGKGAFIGDVHRRSAAYDGKCALVAGCFSRSFDNTLATGEALGVPTDRLYRDYEEMAQKESEREDGIDFVSIVTPNYLHFPAAKAFLLRGISVVSDKPLTIETAEAEELSRIAKEQKCLFCVTYNYTGYPMVKQAREMIKNGDIGEIRIVNAEFTSDWLAQAMADADTPIHLWRTDPKQAGKSNCVADIGSHVENMVLYMTGLEIDQLLAKMDVFGEGMTLDTNAQVMLKYTNGATGNYWCSEIDIGNNNGLNVRVFGSKGAIEWQQENPDFLKVAMLRQPVQILSRGNSYVYPAASGITRLPCGHPEGYYVAFANIYKAFAEAMMQMKTGTPFEDIDKKYPDVDAGVHGVRFINKCLESSNNGNVWVRFED